jgi:hypothetical protein
MTLLSVAVLSTSVLVAWLLWLEHREELGAPARTRNNEHFSTEDKTGRMCSVGSFDEDNEVRFKYELHGIAAFDTWSEDLLLPNIVNIPWRTDWHEHLPVNAPSPVRAKHQGAASDLVIAELERSRNAD